MKPIIDIVGQTFSSLTVIKQLPNKGKRVMWLCKCSCGNDHAVDGPSLKNGHIKSCGCLKIKVCKERNYKHGHNVRGNRLPEYESWVGMKRRCYSPTCSAYKWYGARGITVCDNWLTSFQTFIDDVGPKPTLAHSIDRINNDGNYEASNCKWATKKEQSLNRRKWKWSEKSKKEFCIRNGFKQTENTINCT